MKARKLAKPRNCGRVFAGLLKVAACLNLCVATPALSLGAPAIAGSVYSIVTNPGEDAATQMNIGWHADLGATNCFVTYAKKSDTNWAHAATVNGTCERCDIFNGVYSKTGSGADFNEDAVFLDYGAMLTGLERDTEYMYKIGIEGGVSSPVHYFKTAGAAEFSFLWIGDFHAYPPLSGRLNNAVKVIDAALANDPGVDFIFSTGDVVAWGGSYSFWRLLYEQDFIKNYMFANVLGNHDAMTRTGSTSSAYFKVANNFPGNGYPGQEGVCYWFTYGNVLFITLNNEVMSNRPSEQTIARNWAADVIRRLKGKYRHIFLCEHYQWFDGRAGKTSWYANWKDFCDEYGIALALAGNNHVYQRTHPLYQDKVVADGKGTVYMVVPSSDGDRGVKAGTLTYNAEKLAFTYSRQASSSNAQVKTIGCVLVKVHAEGITTRLVYLDEDAAVHVADEHTTLALPAR
ncbi:MAG TPA: metallophosphoesterase family protein [Candidatus Paceibacterota bacterium]|nr:metallophosphoesterase family protein [Verrucomicrobiota bacterium]HSA10458.1 metallophosphoesterase family protein [Candidatus Paceibacterota bacterium]